MFHIGKTWFHKKWKNNQLHKKAQKLGKTKWYKEYKLRICEVEREYDFRINYKEPQF